MFDTMTMTKITGGFCGAFLVYLFMNWGAESLYHVGADGHGAEGEHAQAYVIEVAEDAGADAGEEEPEVDFGAIMASADAAAGEKVFGKCKACHKVDGGDSTGPHLDGVVGRDIGSVSGFNYSSILAELPGNWTPEELNHFLEKPKDYAPGTKMGFAGLKKISERADVIAYLESIN